MVRLLTGITISIISSILPSVSHARSSYSAIAAPITEVNTSHMSRQTIQDLTCLARNIYHEARGSSYANQIAVAFVARNRSIRYNRSICQIIFEPNQFSWTRHRVRQPSETDAWKRAQRIAYMVMSNDSVEDITRGATHFYEVSMRRPPPWAAHGTLRRRIGAHVFVVMAEKQT